MRKSFSEILRSLSLHAMRGGCCLLAAGGVSSLLSSCDTEAKYDVKKVEIEMTEDLVSAGFAHFQFTTDAPAYYLTGIVEIPDTVYPASSVFPNGYTHGDLLYYYQDQFKTLMLDSAYIDYLEWRHNHLASATHDVADFRDHTLKYGDANQYFQFLRPATHYLVFAFVVDPFTNTPAGDLVWREIDTESESQLDIAFAYRINGQWDCVYPLLMDSDIMADTVRYDLFTDVPWAGATVDSAWLRENNWSHPGAYFTDTFVTISNATSRDNVRVLYGIYAHNNDGFGDGTSSTLFEEGHTYYTGLAALDGPVIGSDGRPKSYAIYRFTWHGPDTQLMLQPGDPADTRGAW